MIEDNLIKFYKGHLGSKKMREWNDTSVVMGMKLASFPTKGQPVTLLR